jgi:hypothetical protein
MENNVYVYPVIGYNQVYKNPKTGNQFFSTILKSVFWLPVGTWLPVYTQFLIG